MGIDNNSKAQLDVEECNNLERKRRVLKSYFTRIEKIITNLESPVMSSYEIRDSLEELSNNKRKYDDI